MMDYAIPAKLTVRKPIIIESITYKCALIITGFSIAYLLTVVITGVAWLPFTGIESDSSELMLSLIQCLLGVAALHIPKFITKLMKIRFPDALCAFFYIFVICGTVLGEMFSLYYAIPIWDSLLHFGSGMMAGMLGSILIVTFLKNNRCDNLISPIFIMIASICFSLCIGVLWEIYEFTADSLLGLNMQKCLLQDGSELIGQAALLDTMKDLIVDTAGAVIAAVTSFVSLKREAGWLHACRNRIAEKKTIQGNFDERQMLPHSA